MPYRIGACMTTIDFNEFDKYVEPQYEQQLKRVFKEKNFVDSIKGAVDAATQSIKAKSNSFVIYGEPQSGKTEMMICLTAKLLDLGYKYIVVLINDNVDLQSQNLERFRLSGLSPAPQSLQEIKTGDPLKPTTPLIIFCKKNSKDLQTLISLMRLIKHRIIIDDEADFATPDSKVNTDKQSVINELVDELRLEASGGIYIGVTATPARLDLNNTFDSDAGSWVYFHPYPSYHGHQTFFPRNNEGDPEYSLITLTDEGDKPEDLKNALIRFLVNVAYLNTTSKDGEQNYCMLVHTSGLRDDHTTDKEIIDKFFEEISNRDNEKKFNLRYQEILSDANERFPNHATEVVKYIYLNNGRKSIKLLNSSIERNFDNIRAATSPQTPFTVAIGGNIISRGVTFNNLLSMFFTRSPKKIQQDTYIQRARMFGNRTGYLKFFELHIPKSLYLDWEQAFALHGLSMASIATGKPIWLEDKSIKAVSRASIDKQFLSIDKGEISFEIFKVKENLLSLTENSTLGQAHLREVMSKLPAENISEHILNFVKMTMPFGDDSIVVHSSRKIKSSDLINDENISRDRGMYGGEDYERDTFPNAVHHFKIFYNNSFKARVIYNYRATDKSIRFLKMNRRPK